MLAFRGLSCPMTTRIEAVIDRLRALPDPEGAEAQAIREVVTITINGIAAGLRNTG